MDFTKFCNLPIIQKQALLGHSSKWLALVPCFVLLLWPITLCYYSCLFPILFIHAYSLWKNHKSQPRNTVIITLTPEQLSKQVSHLLKDFERNREWADIGNWLSRLQPVLAAKKHHNLPHKIQLSKRLAQCLNPSLPSGVHSNTLSVYNTIFNNFSCQNQLLPLFSIGLFPFF